MPNFIPDAQLDNWSAHHPPRSPLVIDAHERIRAGARDLMAIFQEIIPECPDKTVALRAVREAMMQGNAAVACNQPPD